MTSFRPDRLRFVPAIPEPWFTQLVGLYVLTAVVLGWQRQWLLFVLLALATALLLLNQPTRRHVTLWLVATIFGWSTESWLSGHLRLWVYTAPNWGPLPVWLFWDYGVMMLIFVRLAEWNHDRLWTTLSGKPGVLAGLYGAGWVMAIGYGVLVIRVVAPMFAVAYIVLAALVVGCWHRGRDLMLFWVAALLGFLGEASCIAAGVFTYTAPYFAQWGVPISMPLAWGLYAVLLRGVSELLSRPRPNRRLPSASSS